MTWIKRTLLLLPFAIAGILTLLLLLEARLHLRSERIAGYGFLFGTPWAWLLDRDWFGQVHSRWLESLISYAVILWIPALLYCGVLWLVIRAVEGLRSSSA